MLPSRGPGRRLCRGDVAFIDSAFVVAEAEARPNGGGVLCVKGDTLTHVFPRVGVNYLARDRPGHRGGRPFDVQ